MFDSMRHNQANPAFNGSIILLTARNSVILVNSVEPNINLGNLNDEYKIDFVRLKGKNCPSPSFFIGGNYRAEDGEVQSFISTYDIIFSVDSIMGERQTFVTRLPAVNDHEMFFKGAYEIDCEQP